VELAKAEAKDNLDFVLKASALSEAKSQKLIASAGKQLHKKIASITCKTNKRIEKSQMEFALITCKTNKRIEKSQMEFERLQQDCVQATEAAIEAERTIVIIKTDHAIAMKSLKTQHKNAIRDTQARHKNAIRDTQARHVLRFEKQNWSMTNEMNSLRDLIFGQNEMIDGCLDEMKDERRAARQASDSAKQLKVIASYRMDKIKWWKGKCDELTYLQDAYMTQATKMEEMQQRIDEYERLSEEMTEDYEETILSMCPRHIEKARVRNLTNKYGHQEWKPFVNKLIIEFLCNRVPPTCIQLVMVAMSKGKSFTCMSIMLSIND
jgi:hypothetical protein